jgi:hypothetical protein
MRAALLLALATIFTSVEIANAQPSPGRVQVAINGALTATNQTISQDFSVQKNVEAATIATDIRLTRSPLLEAGVRVRLVGGLHLGLAVSSWSRSTEGALDARIPHPFFFNQPRELDGLVTGLTHKETAVHIEAAYVALLGRSVDLSIFGGPSRFNVRQDLVTDVIYSESYPFDTASFVSATTAGTSATASGFNVGADLTWRFAQHFGLGGLLRFSRATTTLSVDSDNEATAEAGGLHAGGGLRVIF